MQCRPSSRGKGVSAVLVVKDRAIFAPGGSRLVCLALSGLQTPSPVVWWQPLVCKRLWVAEAEESHAVHTYLATLAAGWAEDSTRAEAGRLCQASL